MSYLDSVTLQDLLQGSAGQGHSTGPSTSTSCTTYSDTSPSMPLSGSLDTHFSRMVRTGQGKQPHHQSATLPMMIVGGESRRRRGPAIFLFLAFHVLDILNEGDSL